MHSLYLEMLFEAWWGQKARIEKVIDKVTPTFSSDSPFSITTIKPLQIQPHTESTVKLMFFSPSRMCLSLSTTGMILCRSVTASYSSCSYWQSWLSVERQGCSQGFHIVFHIDSWLSTGFTDLLCTSTASSIEARMEWKAGSVSGVWGMDSDGSLDRSKSSGGSW